MKKIIIFIILKKNKKQKKNFIKIKIFKKKIKKKKIEIIFVDDGSIDRSNFLINKFIDKESTKNFIIKLYKLKKKYGQRIRIKNGSSKVLI